VNCLIDVLIVEDSENDALLCSRIKQKSYVPVFQRVETRDDFCRVAKPRWDAVICDYLFANSAARKR